MPLSLSGKNFVVFGAASGLGLATVLALAEGGANVLGCDLSVAPEENPDLPIAWIRADVTSAEDLAKVFSQFKASGRRLDGVVHTAGIVHAERVVSTTSPHSYEAFERVVRINLLGTFNVLRLAAETMRDNVPDVDGGRGVVVNTASIAAYDGQVGQVAYAASKAGVIGMTLPAARDLARFGIRVVTIAPGLFGTPMMESLPDDVKKSLGAQVPFPSRLGYPHEYAELVCEALRNPMLNGTTIRIDGALRLAA